jgi:hypothetical protein
VSNYAGRLFSRAIERLNLGLRMAKALIEHHK